ncbi:MAG: glycosyltransferase family 2 protein [Bacteroidaceae bacterium]|nr:glycosyltransferase family 2 protein [Bacteroidaceae bacterium]
MKVSVVIVNYNVKYYLEQCLRSVERSLSGIEGEVLVVDNDSSDGSVAYLRGLYPDVKFIENKENVGFAKANNKAIGMSEGEYVVLLNPDTIVGEDFFRDCIHLLDSNAEIGATGVRMLNQDGSFAPESRRGVPTPFTAFCKMSGLCKAFPKSRVFGRYHMGFLDADEQNPIDIISGACMFIRRSVLDECGLLDEQFFMYGEDIDLSYRMLKTGKQNYYLPTPILHYKGESTHKNTYRYVYVFYQAMFIFFKKHFGHYGLLLSIPIKSAIYLKGVFEYLARKTKGLFSKDRPDIYYMQANRFLIKSANANTEAIVSLCEHYGLSYDTVENCAEKYDYVLYDTDVFSFKEILADLESRNRSASHPPRIATYSSITKCIITGEMVLGNQ